MVIWQEKATKELEELIGTIGSEIYPEDALVDLDDSIEKIRRVLTKAIKDSGEDEPVEDEEEEFTGETEEIENIINENYPEDNSDLPDISNL